MWRKAAAAVRRLTLRGWDRPWRVALMLCICALSLAGQTLNRQLLEAAKDGRTEQVKQFLSQGANANGRDERGTTALILASEQGHRETVKLLLQARADVNAFRDGGGTALMSAASGGHAEIIAELLESGARNRQQRRRREYGAADRRIQWPSSVHRALARQGGRFGHPE